jgi:hypothetical protein
MATCLVDLPDCVDAATSEDSAGIKALTSWPQTSSTMETMKVLHELFPWWFDHPSDEK